MGIPKVGNPWDNFYDKRCGQCKLPLIGDKPQDIIFDGDLWYHAVCHARALRAFAEAMRLAAISRSIAEYIYHREEM